MATGKPIRQVFDGATSIIVQSMVDTLDGVHYIDKTKNFGYSFTPEDQRRNVFRTKIRWFIFGVSFSLLSVYLSDDFIWSPLNIVVYKL